MIENESLLPHCPSILFSLVGGFRVERNALGLGAHIRFRQNKEAAKDRAHAGEKHFN